jgi:transposase
LAARYKPRPRRATKLDPFKGLCRRSAEVGSAGTDLGEHAALGIARAGVHRYTDGYTMFSGLPSRRRRAAPIVRFETGRGEQMQVDRAVIRRGSSNRLSVFVATLGWSRAAYDRVCQRRPVETLIEAHESAFLAFGETL